MSATTSTIHTIPANPAEDGIVKCLQHQLPARRFVSGTEKNPNRAFYRCSLEDQHKCKFFKWEDELHHTYAAEPSTSQGSSQSPVKIEPRTPTQTKLHFDSPLFQFPASQETAVGTPSSMHHAYSSQETPSKKRRLSTGSSNDEDVFTSPASTSVATKLDFSGSQSTQSSPTKVIKRTEGSSQLAKAIEGMSLAKDVVEKLERKLYAAELGAAHKERKIADLVKQNKDKDEEIRMLAEENQQLRDTLSRD